MWWNFLWASLALTVVFEIITVLFRFGFGLRSREIAPRFYKYTFGIRIHHGYWVVITAPLTLVLCEPGTWSYVIGMAFSVGLAVSDLIHHFVVLPILTGEFD